MKLDDVKVKQGRLIRVKNTKKPIFSNANDWYYSIQVEEANGRGEKCLLFTQKEIERAAYRASRNPEDLTKKNWLTNLFD